MSTLKLFKGNLSNLPVQAQEDALYFVEDSLEIYKGDNLQNLKKYSDIIQLNDENERTSMFTPISNKFYYVKSSKVLYFYDGADWNNLTNNTAITLSGTSQRLSAMNIDGTTKLINAEYTLYQVPITKYVKELKITITNRNTTNVKIKLAHVEGVLGNLSGKDYILYDVELLPNETKIVEIDGVKENDTIAVSSNTINVNFIATGNIFNTDTKFYRLNALNIDNTTNLVNTDYSLYSSANSTKNISVFVCNKDNINNAKVRIALINSNNIADLLDEDYVIYDDLLESNESKLYNLDLDMGTNNIISFRSNISDVNVLIYGEVV